MKKACVIGWPIEHSRSPMIHGYWLKLYGIDGAYTKLAVKPEDLPAFLAALPQSGFAGCNVTVPHKEAALESADIAHASATAVGAANTLWLEDGKLHAANTDTYGYITYLSERFPDWKLGGGPVSILGAGGAARAIIFGFLEAGVEEVRVFNRSPERACALAQHFGHKVKALAWDARSVSSREAAVLVNTTTLGMKGQGATGIEFEKFNPRCVVSDIVYVPLETELLRTARMAGLRTLDGLGMLLHQAVPGFEKWFGQRPEVTGELYRLVADGIAGS